MFRMFRKGDITVLNVHKNPKLLFLSSSNHLVMVQIQHTWYNFTHSNPSYSKSIKYDGNGIKGIGDEWYTSFVYVEKYKIEARGLKTPG